MFYLIFFFVCEYIHRNLRSTLQILLKNAAFRLNTMTLQRKSAARRDGRHMQRD